MGETIYNLGFNQGKIFADDSRFVVAICGRRFGKTRVAEAAIARAAVLKNARIIYVAPTQDQAKSIFWGRLKETIPRNWLYSPPLNSNPQTMTLRNGTIITLHGAQNYDALRGIGVNYFVLDEFPLMPEEIWTEVIRPAIADTGGSGLFIGTPQGMANWGYDIARSPEYSCHTYTTLQGGRVPIAELEKARRQLDERTFKQEFEASFESMSGRVYTGYTEKNYSNQVYNPILDVTLMFDFNVDPMTCIIVQAADNAGYAFCAVKEFVLPNSNTDATCSVVDRFLRESSFNASLRVSGDATGNSRKASASATDYKIIELWFKNYKNYYRKLRTNPQVINRVNNLNSFFAPSAGEPRMFVNIKSCPRLHDDLIRQLWKADGGLDDGGGKIGHRSDALGYFPTTFYPIEVNLPTIFGNV